MESYTPATLPALSYEVASLGAVASTAVSPRTGRIAGRTTSGQDFLIVHDRPSFSQPIRLRRY